MFYVLRLRLATYVLRVTTSVGTLRFTRYDFGRHLTSSVLQQTVLLGGTLRVTCYNFCVGTLRPWTVYVRT